MKTRLFKNWITSLIGILLLMGGSYLVYTGKINFTEFTAFIPTCFLLFRAKDSLLWGKAKGE